MGQVFYRDWVPGSFQDPTYNEAGAKPIIEGMTPYIPRNLPYQPVEYYDNRLSPVSFYLANVQSGYTKAIRDDFYPVSDEAYRFAPEQPVRYDTFSQGAQKMLSPNVSGSAPTRGVYTGRNDLGYE